jgi:TonB family protein
MNTRDRPTRTMAGDSSNNSHRSAPLARWLVHLAARRSPRDLTERLEEEWLADLRAQAGTLAQLRFALGCCWATQVIAYDHLSLGARVASAASGQGTPGGFLPHDSLQFSRRTGIFALILGIHVLAVYGLATGFVPHVFKEVVPNPLRATMLDRPLPPERVIPNRTVVMPTWKPVPIPVDPPMLPPLVESNVELAAVARIATPADPIAPSAPITRVQGGPGAGFPNTEEFYPAASRRIEEAGVTAVQVCVDARGRLTADPVVTQSSGHQRLDAGAVELATAGSGHYRSTTEDGHPVASCFPFKVRFQLK